MSIAVTSHKPGDVLEQGAECVFIAECGVGKDRVCDEVQILLGVTGWTGKSWKTVHDCARVDPGTGRVSVRWRVPKDQSPSDAYVLKVQSHPNNGPTPQVCAEVSGVKVTTPLEIVRVGRDEVQVRWSPGALPADFEKRDGWRLAVDVVPVADAGESHEDVVGDLFLQAATRGLTVHTHHRSVLYDVCKDESNKRSKRLTLTTNRTYRVALAGFTVGELEAVFSTSRAECRMGMVRLAAIGGGYNTLQSGARRVTLGDAEYRRAAPEKPDPPKKTRGGDKTPPKPPHKTPQREGKERDTRDGEEKEKGVGGDEEENVNGESGSGDSPSIRIPDDSNDPDDSDTSRRDGSPGGTSGSVHIGGFEVGERGVGPFGSGRGINVCVLRASDLHVVFERTWDVSGGRKPSEAGAAARSLRAAFEPKVSATVRAGIEIDGGDSGSGVDGSIESAEEDPDAGALAPGSSRRHEWGSHIVAVTTAGGWTMSRGKDDTDHGVGAALDALVNALGGSEEDKAAVKRSVTGSPAGQPAGVAMLAACCANGGVRSRLWCIAGSGPKDRASVALTLGCAKGEWFPALHGGNVGDVAETDAKVPWSAWGEEPWFLNPHTEVGEMDATSGPLNSSSPLEAIARRHERPGALFADDAAVAAFTAESVRVARYRTLVADAKGEMVKEVDTSTRASGGTSTGGTTPRTVATGLTSALLGYARAHLGAAGWVPLCRLRDWTNPKTKTNRGSGDSTEASPNGHHGHRGSHRMSGEEVSLVHQAESLIADLTATRSAYVMSELVAGGAADYLARRLSSLVTSEGRLLPEGGGPPPERFVEGSSGWGAKAGAAIERGIGQLGAKATRVVTTAAALVGPRCGVPADGFAGLSIDDREFDPEVAAEARRLATTLAQLCVHNGAALLPDAVRRCGAQDALIRSFLGGWRGSFGSGGMSEVEACVEELANADLTPIAVTLSAPLNLGSDSDSDVESEGESGGESGGESEPTSSKRIRSVKTVPFATLTALRAGFTYLPSAFKSSTNAAGVVGGKIHVLDVVAPAKPGETIELPDPTPTVIEEEPITTSDSTPPGIKSAPMENGVEPWDGSDAGTVDDEGMADEGMAELMGSPMRVLPFTESAKKLIKNDPNAQGGSGVDLTHLAAGQPPAPAKAINPNPPPAIKGGVAVFRAKDGDWDAHVAMVRQAPRLVLLAQSKGAVAAVFLWPARDDRHPRTQPLLPSPNFDTPVGIPAFVLPAVDLDPAVKDAEIDGWELTTGGGWADAGGSTEAVAARCGDALVAACASRPTPDAAVALRRRAARFDGARARLARAKEDARVKAEEEAAAKRRTEEGRDGGGGEQSYWDVARGWLGYGGKDGGTEEKKGGDEGNDNDETSMEGEGGDVETEKVSGEVAGDAEPRKDAEAEQPAPEPEPEPEPEPDPTIVVDPHELAKAKRWSIAMRIVYALGDRGKPFLDKSFPPSRTSSGGGVGSVRVLCLDGGGIRGVASIVVLERIMAQAGHTYVGECFDLVVGTSTGGIIAIGAGLLRMTVAEVADLYENTAEQIFVSTPYLTAARYGPGHNAARSFESLMTDIMGKEFDQPMYASCAHERWYTAGVGGGGDDDAGKGAGCRPGGPPRICLVSSIVSRTPSTPYLMRSYRRTTTATDVATGEMPGDHRPGAVSALRATTAAPWYMAEHAVQKELGLGRATSDFESAAPGKTGGEYDETDSDGDGAGEREAEHTGHDDASRVTTKLRFVDGAIASNNPTAVGVFEARRLFPRDRKLCVVSLGTGAAIPHEVPSTGYAQGQWVSNLIAATCDVLQVDATVRHVLGAGDRYFRFQPMGKTFGCELNDTKRETMEALRKEATEYLDTEAAKAQVAELAALLRK